MSTETQSGLPSPPAPVTSGSALPVRYLLTMVVSATVMAGSLWAINLARGTRLVDGPVSEGGWTARSRAWFVSRGVYPSELDAASARSFTWTYKDGTLRIPVLDRRDPHVVRLEVRGITPAQGRPPQMLTLSLDGVVVQHAALTGQRQTFDVVVAPARAGSATVGFALSQVFVPGPRDRRELGMIVDGIGLASTSRLRVPTSALVPALGASIALGLAVAILSPALSWALALAIGAALAQALLLSLDAAFLGNVYVWRVLRVDLACLAAAILVGAVWRSAHARPDAGWRIALPIVLVVFAVRVGVFMHPLATVGDSIFHVHRAELVRGGTYFFTSVTPRPFFEFPYAPGLYVVSSPFWDRFPSQVEHVLLLRSLGLVVDALAALALYAAVRRYWGAGAAVVASALFQLVPIGLHTFCTSNLTNAFAQSVFTAALMLWLWSLSRSRALAAATGFAALLALAFLSHFSTLSTGVPIVLAVGLALALARGPERSRWPWTLGALAVALAVSYAIYYSHFHEVYLKTVERVMTREGAEASRSMVAPVSVKVQRFVYAVRAEYFGLPLLAGALGGVGLALARRSRDALSLALGAWLLVVAGFLGLGVVTPIEMRAALAGQPLAAAFFGLSVAALWRWHLSGRAVAALLVTAVIVRGCSDWLLCLGLTPR